MPQKTKRKIRFRNDLVIDFAICEDSQQDAKKLYSVIF